MPYTQLMAPCRICGNAEGNAAHLARESGFGWDEQFAYLECSACGCLQIADIPPDLARYYPAEYYSYTPPQFPAQNALMRWLKLQRTAYCLGGFNPVGWLVARAQGIPAHLDWLRRMRLRRDARILDVGCGAGELLLHLRSLGCTALTGVDPLLPQDIDYGNGLRIYKRSVEDIAPAFDLVMLNHTLEHLPDQDGALAQVRRLLPDGGWALCRIPLTGTHAWRTYGVHWAQLDPPRHLYLHSRESFELLAQRHGFAVQQVLFDSTAFQFWGSEQNRQGIALYSDRSYLHHPEAAPFTAEQIAEYEDKARQLNAANDGDQACFFLQKA